MELKKNDVSRDRDPCYFFFLFSTSVLIFSLPLGLLRSSFFYDGVGSSLSIQSFFFFFTNGPSFSAILLSSSSSSRSSPPTIRFGCPFVLVPFSCFG